MKKLAFPALLLSLTSALTARADTLEEHNWPLVGTLGQISNIVFEGQKFFPDQELRRVLQSQLSFVLAADAGQPLPPFLEIIQRLLRAGYETSGFPDAKIEAGLNNSSNRVVIRIDEGQRFYCGSIRVEGLKTLSTNSVMASLEQQLWPSTETNATGSSAAPRTTPSRRPKAQSEQQWNPGHPASLDPAKWARVELLASNAFWELGHPLAEFTVDFPRRAARDGEAALIAQENSSLSAQELAALKGTESKVVDMLIQVSNEGPACKVSGVHAQGTRNSDEDLAKFMGLEPGTPYTLSWRQKQLDLLEQSGRFTRVSPAKEVFQPNGQVTPQFEFEDLPEAPPLSTPLRPNSATLLRMHRWVQDWTNRTEDLVWEFRGVTSKGSTNSIEFICSPRGSVVCRLFSSVKGGPEATPKLQFIVRPGSVGMSLPDSGAIFLNTNFGAALELRLQTEVSAQPNNSGNRANMTFAFGFSSPNKDKPPLALALQTAPSAMLFLGSRPDFSWTTETNFLMGTQSNVVLKVEPATGRLVELKGAYQLPTELTNWLRSGEWLFTFREGQFALAEADWDRATASRSNLYDPAHPLATGLTYLAGGMVRSKDFAACLPTNLPAANAAALQGALVRLFDTSFFSCLERLGPPAQPPEDKRMGTPFLSANMGDQAMQVLQSLAALVLVRVPEAVPANSWLEAAVKIPLFRFVGEGRRIDAVMGPLFNDKQLGPIACLVLGQEMPVANASRRLGVAGLIHSDEEAFLKDSRVMMDERSVVGQMAAGLCRWLAGLDEKELTAVAMLLKEPDQRLVREAAMALRDPNRRSLGALEPLLARWWNASLKEPVKAELRKLTRARDD